MQEYELCEVRLHVCVCLCTIHLTTGEDFPSGKGFLISVSLILFEVLQKLMVWDEWISLMVSTSIPIVIVNVDVPFLGATCCILLSYRHVYFTYFPNWFGLCSVGPNRNSFGEFI